MGVDSDDCAPTSGFALEDAAQAAERCVASLREQGADLIICLSHSGTSEDPKLSEDELLAKAVDGIDVIISGHTHTTLAEPIQVGDTWIVSCGEYSKNLGVVTMAYKPDGDMILTDYELIPIDDSVAEDPDMAAWIENAKGEVESLINLENYVRKQLGII